MHLIRRLAAAAALGMAGFLLWLLFVWPPPSWWGTHWPAQTAFMALPARALRAAEAGGARLIRQGLGMPVIEIV